MSHRVSSITQMPVFAHDVTSDSKAFEQPVYFHLVQGQTKQSNFIYYYVTFRSITELEGAVTDGVPSMIGSKIVWRRFFTSIPTS
jgi:hypothetical protein